MNTIVRYPERDNLLCYSTANVVESSYGLDNLEVANHANSSMENDVMMLMQLATCKLCFCQFSFIHLVNKTCKRKTKIYMQAVVRIRR